MTERNAVLAALAALVGPCPVCRNGRFTPVFDGVQTNMLCEECGACWHPCADLICRVDPEVCPGCDLRPVCTEARTRYQRALAGSWPEEVAADQG